MRAYILTTADNHGRTADLSYYPKVLPTPELFYGVTPDTCTVPEYWLERYKSMKTGDVPERVYCCGKSKELLIRQHIERFPTEDLLLMEDDVFFTEDADKKFTQFFYDIPNDWGLLYLGGWHEFSCQGAPPLEIKPGILRCVNALGNEALVIRSTLLNIVAEQLMHSPDNLYCHSDWRLVPLQRRYLAYSPIGFVAGQQSGWSNLFQKDREMGIKNDFCYEGMDRKIHVYGHLKNNCEP